MAEQSSGPRVEPWSHRTVDASSQHAGHHRAATPGANHRQLPTTCQSSQISSTQPHRRCSEPDLACRHTTSKPIRVGSIWPALWVCTATGLSAGRWRIICALSCPWRPSGWRLEEEHLSPLPDAICQGQRFQDRRDAVGGRDCGAPTNSASWATSSHLVYTSLYKRAWPWRNSAAAQRDGGTSQVPHLPCIKV
ncbi:hypothetical protein ACVMB1_000218 [Bradyrhizobium sp. USDA 4504]